MPDSKALDLARRASALDLAYRRLADAEEEFFAAMGDLGRATTAARAAFDSDNNFRAWRRENVSISASPLAPTREEIEAAEWLAPLMEANGESFHELRRCHPRVLPVRTLRKKWRDAATREQKKAGIPNPEAEAQRKLVQEELSSKVTDLGRALQGLKR